MVRRAARVDDNHSDIRRALERVGCTVHSSAALGGGFPDLIVWTPWLRRIVLLEIKDGDKPASRQRLTPDQEKFHARWPGDAYVVANAVSALLVVGAPDGAIDAYAAA